MRSYQHARRPASSHKGKNHMNPTVSGESLSKTFISGSTRVHAINNVSVSFTHSGVHLLMGESGSGKSTLINLLAGLDTPDSGSVYAEGVTVSDQSEASRAQFRLRHIAVIFQDDNLIAELTNTENIALPLWAQGTSKSDATEIAHEAMRKLGIESLGRRHPGEVSGGQRQRVGVARALASGQHILLADEPTGALDSTTSEGLFELLGNLAHDNQMCVIVATHDPLATKRCDSVTTLLDGQIVA